MIRLDDRWRIDYDDNCWMLVDARNTRKKPRVRGYYGTLNALCVAYLDRRAKGCAGLREVQASWASALDRIREIVQGLDDKALGSKIASAEDFSDL